MSLNSLKISIFLSLLAIMLASPMQLEAKDLNKIEIAQNNNFNDDFEEFDDEEFDDFADLTTSKITIYDPFERVNRKIYAFNDGFDRYFFQYIAKGYHIAVPQKIRFSLHNFLVNLTLPISGINSALQGDVDNSLATFSNFLINSTIGLGGFFNIAQKKGIEYRSEDFGQTLAHYNIGNGAFLVIPILGPSTTRDFAGWAVDRAIDPTGLNGLEIAKDKKMMNDDNRLAVNALSAIDTRERLIDTIDSLRKDSFDPYATLRSAYLQGREAKIKNNK